MARSQATRQGRSKADQTRRRRRDPVLTQLAATGARRDTRNSFMANIILQDLDKRRIPFFGDIPLRSAMIAWNRLDETQGKPGAVMIIPWPDEKGYCDLFELTMTCGACMSYWQSIPKHKVLMQLFIEAWYIVCRDGVSPKDMHEALIVIPEYRDTWNGETLFKF